jgi:hypothetical protein
MTASVTSAGTAQVQSGGQLGRRRRLPEAAIPGRLDVGAVITRANITVSHQK